MVTICQSCVHSLFLLSPRAKKSVNISVIWIIWVWTHTLRFNVLDNLPSSWGECKMAAMMANQGNVAENESYFFKF